MAPIDSAFARISAALSIDFKDYSAHGRRMWTQLKEKGGRQHAMPCHHKLEEYLDAYVTAAGIQHQKSGQLFRSAQGRTGVLTEKRLRPRNAYDAIRRLAKQAELATEICPHTFRATEIANYLINSDSSEIAQQMAGHADARTTKLYDRRNEQVSLDEVERITI